MLLVILLTIFCVKHGSKSLQAYSSRNANIALNDHNHCHIVMVVENSCVTFIVHSFKHTCSHLHDLSDQVTVGVRVVICVLVCHTLLFKVFLLASVTRQLEVQSYAVTDTNISLVT